MRGRPRGLRTMMRSALVDMWYALGTGDLDRYASHFHPELTGVSVDGRVHCRGNGLVPRLKTARRTVGVATLRPDR